MEFVIETIRKHLKYWIHPILSIASWLILLKHVLQAILIYFIMVFEYNHSRYQVLEIVYSEFLWGFPTFILGQACRSTSSSMGYKCTDYLTWGLNLQSFKSFSSQLKIHHVSSLILQHPIKWVFMTNDIIQSDLRGGILK